MTCACAYVSGLPYGDVWDYLLSGWLNFEGDKVYVADDFTLTTSVDEYAFPAMTFIKAVDLNGVTVSNIASAAAGKESAVYTWAQPTFNGTDYDHELWRHTTDDDVSSMILTNTTGSTTTPQCYYDPAYARLYSLWEDGELWQTDAGGGNNVVWNLPGSAIVTDLVGIERPVTTNDGRIWLTARDATFYGFLAIDPDTGDDEFYPIDNYSGGSFVGASTDGWVVRTNAGDPPTNWQLEDGVVSPDGCDYGAGLYPYYSCLTGAGVAYFLWYGDDLGVWWWNCPPTMRWFLGRAGI